MSCSTRYHVASDLSTGEILPGSAVPDDGEGGTDADWQAWILQTFTSVAHPIGTASMMRRELGGTFRPHDLIYWLISRCRRGRRISESVRHVQCPRCRRVNLPDAAERASERIGVWRCGEGGRFDQGCAVKIQSCTLTRHNSQTRHQQPEGTVKSSV